MSDETYKAMRAFITAAVELEAVKFRTANPLVAGKDGQDGQDGQSGKDGVATRAEIDQVVKSAVAEFVPEVVQKEIEAKIATMPEIKYIDVWREGTEAKKGNLATYAGSLWHANENTTEKPGEGSKAWTLTVKRGRDGKDAK